MTTFKVTLNRAHKIAERLGQRASEVKDEATKLAGQVLLQGYTPGQIERLTNNGTNTLVLLKEHASLAQAQGSIRAAIGRANANVGVSDTLNKIEVNKKVLAALNAVIGEQRADQAVQAREVADYKTMTEGSTMRGNHINVAVLSPEQNAELKAEVTRIERLNFGLADELASLNATTMEIELDDKLADLVGLV
jgi:hypothetical protein